MTIPALTLLFLAIYHIVFMAIFPLFLLPKRVGFVVLVPECFACQLDEQFLQSVWPLYFARLVAQRQELLERAHSDDEPLVHNGNVVAETLGLFHIVSSVEDGRSLVAQLLNGVKDVLPGLGVYADGWLIHQ